MPLKGDVFRHAPDQTVCGLRGCLRQTPAGPANLRVPAKSVTTILPWRINYLRKIACCAPASLELEENQRHRHSDAFWLRGPTEPALKVRPRRKGSSALPKTPSATACSPDASSWIRNPAQPSKPC